MGKRSTSRRLAMQALYQLDLSSAALEEILDDLYKEEEYLQETKTFASQLVRDTLKHKDEIDALITQYAKNWKLQRMNRVDVSILRLSLFELSYTDVPPSVIINEAIELAKKYSGQGSAKFVNGILGAFVKQR